LLVQQARAFIVVARPCREPVAAQGDGQPVAITERAAERGALFKVQFSASVVALADRQESGGAERVRSQFRRRVPGALQRRGKALAPLAEEAARLPEPPERAGQPQSGYAVIAGWGP